MSNSSSFWWPCCSLCKHLPGCFIKIVMSIPKLISPKHENIMYYIFMQYFNMCELHEIVSQPQYPGLWSWQACENFPIPFIHSLTQFHFTDWKGFNYFCYFFFFPPTNLNPCVHGTLAHQMRSSIYYIEGVVSALYKFVFADWYLSLKSFPFICAMFRTE